MKNIYHQLGIGGSYGLLAGGAPGFFLAALAGNQMLGCYCAVAIVFGLIGILLPWGDDVAALPKQDDATAAEVVEAWVELNDQRIDVAVQRVQLGIVHGEVNRKVVRLEEALINGYSGEKVHLSDGRIVTIGFPGCRHSERIRVTQP